MSEWTKQFWFGEAFLGLLFGGVLLAAALLSPTAEAVSLFGYEVPTVCAFRQAFDMGCPGCGLTRSFSFMAHGQVGTAFQMNWLGPLLFLAFASQPPYRLYRIARWKFSAMGSR